MQERLQKFISQAGIASRRHAEELIVAGRVKINGKIIKELGTKVDPDKDAVEVDGKKIKPTKLVYLIFNKPKRYMTTRHDPQKRKTVFDLLPKELRNVVWPVGRLDFNTEGLLILTNDGELTQTLTHPSKEYEKEYEVVLDKELSAGKLEKIRSGVFLPASPKTAQLRSREARRASRGGDGKQTAPAKVRVDGSKVYLTIHEGWNRQVRRMFSVLGYTVRNLKRIRIGKLKLSGLQLREYKFIEKKDII